MVTLHLPLLIFPLSFCVTFWFFIGLPFVSWLTSVTATIVLITFSAWKLSCFLATVTQGSLDISNKAVLITGCDSGFGYITALQLNEKGFNVLAGVKDPDGQGAHDLVNSCKYPSRLHILDLDVTKDETELKNALLGKVESILSSTGDCLWAVVNNAGLLSVGPIEWGDYQDAVKSLVDVNLLGTIKITRIFLPLLKQSSSPIFGGPTVGGRIINISSVQGKMSIPWAPIYSTTKSAIIFFSNCLRLNVLRFGIKVTTILPYKYRTPMGDTSFLVSGLDKSWLKSSQEVKSSYGEYYFENIKQFINKIDSFGPASGDPSEIASNIYRCLVIPDPPNEIVCSPLIFRPLWYLVGFLPQEWIDFVFDYIESNYIQSS